MRVNEKIVERWAAGSSAAGPLGTFGRILEDGRRYSDRARDCTFAAVYDWRRIEAVRHRKCQVNIATTVRIVHSDLFRQMRTILGDKRELVPTRVVLVMTKMVRGSTSLVHAVRSNHVPAELEADYCAEDEEESPGHGFFILSALTPLCACVWPGVCAADGKMAPKKRPRGTLQEQLFRGG